MDSKRKIASHEVADKPNKQQAKGQQKANTEHLGDALGRQLVFHGVLPFNMCTARVGLADSAGAPLVE